MGFPMAILKRYQTILALLFCTLLLCIGYVNLKDRLDWKPYYDGLEWQERDGRLQVKRVHERLFSARSGSARIEPGDRLVSINNIPVRGLEEFNSTAEFLEDLEIGSPVEYSIEKSADGEPILFAGQNRRRSEFDGTSSLLVIVALLYLGIGAFIYLRSGSARSAFHFFLLCFAASVALLLKFSGRAGGFDQLVYWVDSFSLILLAPLFLHFCCVFPKPVSALQRMPRLRSAIYAPAFLLAVFSVLWLLGWLQPFGLPRGQQQFDWLYQLQTAHLVFFFLLAAIILFKVQRESASALERQQMKWISYGTFLGITPFALLSALPFALGIELPAEVDASVLSLALIPLSFGYAITRFRLMDVDVIFKRGAAYALTSSALVAGYVALVLLLGRGVQSASGESGFWVFAVSALMMAFLFAPLKDRVQGRIDRSFYKDRYRHRASFAEFGRSLGSEIDLRDLSDKICQRIQDALAVAPVLLFLKDEQGPDTFRVYLSQRSDGPVRFPDSLSVPRRCLASPGPVPVGDEDLDELPGDVRESLRMRGLEQLQPLRVRGRLIGFMGIGRRLDGGPLSSEDLQLVTALADYAAIAIDNAALYDSLKSKANQLTQLKAYSESVVESITVGVAVVDPQGIVTVWNSAMQDIGGRSCAQALGKHIEDLLHPDLTSSMRTLLDGPGWAVAGTRQLYKTRIEDEDGKGRLANVVLSPFVGQDGQETGLLILFEDITEKQQLEGQLQQAEKLSSIGIFAAGVAHEVNTPLAGISSYAQMLLTKTEPKDPAYGTLKKIENQSFRASQIINNLLNFARVSGSEAGEVSLNSLMVETISLLEHQFKRGAVDVQMDLDPYLPKTFGVKGKLQQVFMNLFLNARDAMPEGGRLRVRTYQHNSQAIIEVADTGEGIAEENLKRIYDPFFTTKEVGKGTGLGLSVSYGIVQEHAGRISVESRAGQGTTFHINLPIKRVN